MAGEAVEINGDGSNEVLAAIDDLYQVFRSYRLRPHMDACPCCTSDHDRARVQASSLRALGVDDLDRYVRKAMTTWGDENDFRHFLPRVLELTVDEADSFVEIEIILGKLAYAEWARWPAAERIAIESFLGPRWDLGLRQDPSDDVRGSHSQFDADSWLCGIALTGLDTKPYVDAWRRRGAASTVGHVAAFLELNPNLITAGTLGNPFWEPGTPQASACADQMRVWLRACLDDPEFQAQLSAWYEQ